MGPGQPLMKRLLKVRARDPSVEQVQVQVPREAQEPGQAPEPREAQAVPGEAQARQSQHSVSARGPGQEPGPAVQVPLAAERVPCMAPLQAEEQADPGPVQAQDLRVQQDPSDRVPDRRATPDRVSASAFP